MFVDSDDFAESLTSGAGSDGGVEREHLVGGLFKLYSVGFEFGAERMKLGCPVGQVETQQAGAVAFVHRRFCRVCEPAHGILAVIAAHAVDQQIDGVFFVIGIIFDAGHFAVHFQSGKSLLHVHFNLLGERASLAWKDGREHRIAHPFRVCQHAVYDVFGAVLLHQFAADGRISLSDACKQQAEVFIDFGRSSYGGARVAADNLLFDGYGWRDSLDEVAFRFSHSSQKLAGV